MRVIITLAVLVEDPGKPPMTRAPLLTVALLGTACADLAGDARETADSGSTEDATLPEYGGEVDGFVVDPTGQPLAALAIALCGGICQRVETGADGSFHFEGAWPQVNVLETQTYPGEDQSVAVYEWSRYFDLLEIAEDEEIVLERPLTVHPVETVGPLSGPQDLRPAAGLHVRFDANVFGVRYPTAPGPWPSGISRTKMPTPSPPICPQRSPLEPKWPSWWWTTYTASRRALW